MRALVALVLAFALALGGCTSAGDGGDGPKTGGEEAEKAQTERDTPTPTTEPEKIRAWSKALNSGDFEEAASFFAEDAVVQQLEEERLDGRESAEAFNRSLPCKADVTDVKDEGETVLVAFRLRDGPGGPCEGAARVRFRFEDGKFAEWRQISAPDAPEGEIARSAFFG
ncbi:MAG: nuclear transport factor 2 family protein [Thermoleophilaceae bacterium]